VFDQLRQGTCACFVYLAQQISQGPLPQDQLQLRRLRGEVEQLQGKLREREAEAREARGRARDA
jgi:hypothetical protein